MRAVPTGSFLERNEFLLRRLHSLSGMVPVGAYMVIHLLTNASVLDGPAAFQRRGLACHTVGGRPPLGGWAFIFFSPHVPSDYFVAHRRRGPAASRTCTGASD